MTARPRLSDIAERHAGLILSAAVVAGLMIVSLLNGSFGQVGPDGDDQMRLLQVRELLDGKGWFDLGQPRLGPEGGTEMHWSRLVDLPIAFLTLLMAPLLGREQALLAAITGWPMLSVLIVTGGLVYGARALGGRGLLLFACLLGFAVLFRHFRFLPGAIDHHNLQLGLVLLGAACLLSRDRPPAAAAIAAAALALAAAMGGEVYVFVAAMAAFVALDWALRVPAQRSAVIFGALCGDADGGVPGDREPARIRRDPLRRAVARLAAGGAWRRGGVCACGAAYIGANARRAACGAGRGGNPLRRHRAGAGAAMPVKPAERPVAGSENAVACAGG